MSTLHTPVSPPALILSPFSFNILLYTDFVHKIEIKEYSLLPDRLGYYKIAILINLLNNSEGKSVSFIALYSIQGFSSFCE